MKKTAIALAGAALGAGSMYLLDPAGGRRRRALLGDALTHASHRTRVAAVTSARNARHRLTGAVAETVARVLPTAPTDAVLVARVRARLGRLVTHPGAIDVTAAGGTVTLSGAVFAAEVEPLLAGVAAVAGVTAVESQLTPHQDGAHVPSLQGAGPHAVPAARARRRRWVPALAGMAVGLTAVALSRGRWPIEGEGTEPNGREPVPAE